MKAEDVCNGHTFIDSRMPPFVTYGVFFDETLGQYVRMPAQIADTISEGVSGHNTYTSGGRVRFKTDSQSVTIKCVLRLLSPHSVISRWGGLSPITVRGFSLYIDGKFFKVFRPVTFENLNGDERAYTSRIDFPDKRLRNITIYYPLYNEVIKLDIAVADASTILPPDAYTICKPLLFYGSSITQGANASRPGMSYDAIVCRALDADYINLGFSGNAKGERAMAQYLGGLDVSLFVMDYDHNAPDEAHLQDTHYPFYALYRQLRPNVPIIMLSRPNYDTEPEISFARRKIIEDSYTKGKANGDEKLYYIDGETLFGNEHRDGCTADSCHPNDLGFQRMSETVLPVLKKALRG